jgi:trigger factor
LDERNKTKNSETPENTRAWRNGRRTRLRIWRGDPWEFKSPRPHFGSLQNNSPLLAHFLSLTVPIFSVETQNFILEGCQREVTILYTRAELQPHFDKVYATAQPSVQLPGFRKGKVPLNMIKQRFGKELENDALEGIANEGFQEFVKTESVTPVSHPQLRDIQRENDGSVKFTIAYEVLPEFELGSYRGIEIRKLVRENQDTNADVEREIEGLLLRFGTQEDASTVADEFHTANLKLNLLDAATGTPILGTKAEEFSLLLKQEPEDSEIRTKLMGKNVGDSLTMMMPMPESGAPQPVMITVQGIQRTIPAEFTNEFVERTTGGKFVTTEELREEYERQINDFWEDRSNRIMDDQIVEQILAMHDFEPPSGVVQDVLSAMLREQVEKLPNKKLPPNFDIRLYAERTMPTARTTAKWMLIRDRIITAENLKVEDSDIDKRVSELAESLGTAENFEYLRSMIAGNEEVQHRIIQEKVMETLRGYAVVTEVSETEYAEQRKAALAELRAAEQASNNGGNSPLIIA